MDYSDVFLRYAARHTWTHLAPSPIHGIGVFALQEIPPNTDPFPDCQNLFKDIPIESLDHLPIVVQKMVKDFLYHDEERVWIPNLTPNQINISFFLNSSNNPNCEHHENGRITTLRKIRAGEELTHCYQFQEKDEQRWESSKGS